MSAAPRGPRFVHLPAGQLPPERAPVVMGQPVDLNDLDEPARQAYAEVAAELGVVPVDYDGQVQARCQRCQMRIWLGPKSAAIRDTDPRTTVVCIQCMATMTAASQGPVLTSGLGNTATSPREDLPAWLRAPERPR